MLAEFIEKADAFLHEEWRELRNDGSPGAALHFSGMIRAYHRIGLLTDDQRELWGRRSHTCPGHDDEGGRSWCAFCGPLRSCSQADANCEGDMRQLDGTWLCGWHACVR